MVDVVEQYRSRTPRSAAMAVRAEACMPGGDTRATVHHLPYPLTFMGGTGAELTDADGNHYIDLSGNYTALVHGNAYPPVVEAMAAAASSGTAWAGRCASQVELAELLCDRVASVERVRFTNSGSEATMLATELARAVTGRPKILMATYGYHGSAPEFSVGTEGKEGRSTLVAPYGDASAFEEVLERQGDEVALVILEPVMGAAGIIAPPEGFIAEVAASAHAAGALFCIDEIITFRLGTAGAQALHGVTPDLTTFGKLIGGGLPVGALGGRADLMAVFDPRRPAGLHHSGTFNGNPATTAAGVVSVSHLTAERIEHIDRLADRLADGLQHLAADAGLPFAARRSGSLLNCYLSEQPPAANAVRTDAEAMSLLHLAALNAGVFFADRGTMATSTVMTDATVDAAFDRLAGAFAAVRDVVAG